MQNAILGELMTSYQTAKEGNYYIKYLSLMSFNITPKVRTYFGGASKQGSHIPLIEILWFWDEADCMGTKSRYISNNLQGACRQLFAFTQSNA